MPPRRLNPYRTPTSIAKKQRTGWKTVRNVAADMADTAGAVYQGKFGKAVKRFVRGGKRVYKYATSRKSKNAATQTVVVPAMRGFSGTVSLAGKLRNGRRYSKKVKINGKFTPFGIAKKGITLNCEQRKIVTAEEGLLVGHTSMPGKVCAMNLWRGILKHLILQTKTYIKDYGELMTNYGFVVNDTIRLWFYAAETVDTLSSTDFTVSSSATFDSMTNYFTQYAAGTLNMDDRLHQMTYYPHSTSQKQQVTINLDSLKVAVHTKSVLKMQNVTVETNADNESDDVTRVPLQGKLYHCKGNNFKRKVGNKILTGLYNTWDESALFESSTRAVATLDNNMGYYEAGVGPINNQQTTFYKTSETPKPYEVENCLTSGSFYIPSGGIKSSILTTTYEMSLISYLKIIYAGIAAQNLALQYNPKQGLCDTIYLEKVVGTASTAENSIKLWTELQFTQNVLVFGGSIGWTAPITYQANY